MTDSTKPTYIFHCGEYETERSFKVEPTDEDLMEKFDEWALQYGYESDELDDMFAEGEAGYYEV